MRLTEREATVLHLAVQLRIHALMMWGANKDIIATFGESGARTLCSAAEEYAALLKKIERSRKGTQRWASGAVTDEERRNIDAQRGKEGA